MAESTTPSISKEIADLYGELMNLLEPTWTSGIGTAGRRSGR